MTVSSMNDEKIADLMTGPLKRFLDPGFIKHHVFTGMPDSRQDKAVFELLHLRRMVHEIRWGRRTLGVTVVNVLLTLCLVAVTAVNVWINSRDLGDPQAPTAALAPAVVQLPSKPIPVDVAGMSVFPTWAPLGVDPWNCELRHNAAFTLTAPDHLLSALHDVARVAREVAGPEGRRRHDLYPSDPKVFHELEALLEDACCYAPDPSISPLVTEMVGFLRVTHELYKTGTYARRQELDAERKALARQLVERYIVSWVLSS